jgi:hypothetical protein
MVWTRQSGDQGKQPPAIEGDPRKKSSWVPGALKRIARPDIVVARGIE